ncbi:MAG: 2-amino-4-hydroxy-6-hydroxymethyldihydropteridine diphosphokinase [Lachnoclostridium sp.]|nr:2-amino-4-hydroxy-6-hydroxymethyldihydropteridine diphosphokinase [Lachnoclostridium sp.]
MTIYPCTIGLGSNTGNREENIKRAIDFLQSILSDTEVSSIYESPAFNGVDGPYLNAVVHGFTSIEPEELINKLKSWEESEGREKNGHGEVVIDLDLVIYNFRILRQEDFERHYFNKGYRELLARGTYVSK